MEGPRQQEQIGARWIAAMVVLVILLVLGILLYWRMSVPLHGSGRRGEGGRVSTPSGASAQAATSLHLRASTEWPKPRAWV